MLTTFALPSFASNPTSSSAAYQLLPSTSTSSVADDPLLPAARSSRKRTKKAVLVACVVGASLALLTGWDAGLGRLGQTTAVGKPASSSAEDDQLGLGWSDTGEWEGGLDEEATEPVDPSGSDEQDDERDPDDPVLLAELDHAHQPRIRLPSTPRLPSEELLPYPAPSAACLLHLYTLTSPSEFDRSICPPAASPEPLDSVTTFVNGTGPLFLDAYAKASAAEGVEGSIARHYSNMGEMRFSLRSVARGLVGERASKGTIRGVGSDFAVPGGGSDGQERIAQIPNWLNYSLLDRSWDPHPGHVATPHDTRAISWSFHSEIFLGAPFWIASALPTFNSFAIESQIHNIPSLSSTFVSFNDDFFLLRPLSASDFHTELLGPVFRVQDDLKVVGKENARVGDSGEWAALDWAAWTLGKRHPSASLEYLTHLPKALTVAHLHEISLVFRDTLQASSRRRFREQNTSGPDVEIAFLATHYIRQRHREALLFSFVVARSGGTWHRREREELVSLGVDGWKGHVGDGLIDRSGLGTDGLAKLIERSGEEVMRATKAEFSSFSGLPKINFQPPLPRPLDLANCLGPWWVSDDEDEEIDAVWIFRRVTFEQHRCGDLLITAILNLSPASSPGLTALLPRPGSFFLPDGDPGEIEPHIYSVPHLPLTSTWEEASFSLPDLLPAWSGLPSQGVDLQDFILRLLGRYRYVMGSTPSHFTSIRHVSSMKQLTRLLAEPTRNETAMLALNDDVPAYLGAKERKVMEGQVREWGEGRWPGRERWEMEV